MEEIKNEQSVYTEPKIKMIYLAETDIITTSGWEGEDNEGEIRPIG